jgi:cellulose synthase (UDP-forming)
MQYVLSGMFFISGWTFAVYMALPVVRIFNGAQPLARTSADQFLAHFAPYYGLCLLTVAVAGAGTYTFAAFALMISTFWVHVVSSLFVLARRRGRFVVTPKQGTARRQILPVMPTLLAAGVLAAAGGYGLASSRSPATLNNVAFATLHVSVLLAGAWPALTREPEPKAVAERVHPARRAGQPTTV